MRAALFSLLMISGLVLVGCSDVPETGQPANDTTQTETTKTSIANTKCPVMGSDVNPDLPTAEWNGKTIGFCCEAGKCKEKFLAMSDDEKKAALEGKLK